MAILEVAVLAELQLGLDALELHAEGDDVLGLLRRVAGRQAAEAPCFVAGAFVLRGKLGQHHQHGGRRLDDLGRP